MSANEHKCGGCCPGPVGSVGPMGQQGIQGIAGPMGQAGQAGPQGVAGMAGDPGLPGIDGLPGKDGLQGVMGPAGPRGITGATGQTGLQGQPGQNGATGPAGPSGPMGPQGIQGIPGNCIECPCHCDQPEFAEVYSQKSQELLPSPGANLAGGVVLFEKNIVATSNIDISLAATLGQIKINLAGWYDMAAGMTGLLNPIPAPLPVWTLSLFLNGIIVDGSTFSNLPLSPAQASNEITADTFVYCNVGDIITLANTSTAPVFLSAPSLGTNAQTNSTYLKMILLRAGAK
jgi:Collagen triple helix repeat (20 copies)